MKQKKLLLKIKILCIVPLTQLWQVQQGKTLMLNSFSLVMISKIRNMTIWLSH